MRIISSFSCILLLVHARLSNSVNVSNQTLHPVLSLFGIFSCGLGGDEQASIPFRHEGGATASTNLHPDPWSYDLICTQSFSQISSPLCIYTSITFGSGRGVSLFTKPSIANIALQLHPFKDPSYVPGSRTGTPFPWRTASLPGRGTGLLATRQLDFGDLIAAYTPVLLVHRNVATLMATPDLESLLRIAVEQLPQPSRDMLLGLARSFEGHDFHIQDIMQTNAFEVEIGGEMHLAIFPEASRINHDCGPNSQYYLDASRLTHYVHAMRSIAVGEEISVTYSFQIVPYSVRSANLQRAFHFNCTCSRCNDPNSDSRVSVIQSVEAALSDWTSSSLAAAQGAGVRMAEQLIALYKEERLHATLGRAYSFAALEYSAAGNEERAAEYAGLAIAYAQLMHGDFGQEVFRMRELQVDVKKHWSWQRRL